jgi:Uma2 family endonuclease
MVALRKKRMNVDEFLAWAEGRSDRLELIDGVPVAMSPERVIHGDVKYRLARAFDRAIERADVPCRFVLDSAAVRIDPENSFQPDVMVYRGDAIDANALVVPNPLIVAEVLSPGNAMRDLRDKLAGYFLVASLMHYLIVDPDKRMVIHHARGESGTIVTRIVTEGAIKLEPPGFEIEATEILG